MTLPAHATQTLADIRAARTRLDETEAALLLFYGEGQQGPAIVSPPPPVLQVAKPARVVPPSSPKTKAPTRSRGSQHDEAILRFLKSEEAQHGVGLMDIARAVVGKARPEEASKVSGGIHQALASLQKRGLALKDGRFWYVVRPGVEAAS